MNLVLFGFMGVGKSTVGKLLALKIHYPFIDLDSEIVKEVGKSISEIFNIYGESGFRKIEKDKILEISTLDKHVIALGGGAVLDYDNVKNLRNQSILIHLTAKSEEVLHRLRNDDSRPLLQKGDKINNINLLLKERTKIYQKIADFSIITDNKTPEEVTSEIIFKVGKDI
ncbi:shikimate kinase [Candidatus Bathyarchaeota archaeon]|nr:shikimate kinase [Candidatus Bathyarchaeota archaeon]